MCIRDSYGSETMDMDPQTIKAVWGFNGTERPGAVYLASVLATHAQKGLPAFGIYGHDVCEADDTSIPEDVQEKLLRFGRAAVAAASMRGKSYIPVSYTHLVILQKLKKYIKAGFLKPQRNLQKFSEKLYFFRRWSVQM